MQYRFEHDDAARTAYPADSTAPRAGSAPWRSRVYNLEVEHPRIAIDRHPRRFLTLRRRLPAIRLTLEMSGDNAQLSRLSIRLQVDASDQPVSGQDRQAVIAE